MRELITSRWAIWSAIFVTCVGAVIAHFAQNALLQLFATKEPELWQQAGKPSGLFAPPRGSFFGPRDLSKVPSFLTQPPWLARYPEAGRLLRLQRIGTVFLLLGLVLLGTAVICA